MNGARTTSTPFHERNKIERVREGLERTPGEVGDRRRTRRRRGWIVRRVLVLADVIGLGLAFVVAQVLFRAHGSDAVTPITELLIFVATVPAWVLIGNLYGLYERDEERADHSTVDELVGVFHMVTVGAWLLYAVGWISGIIDPYLPKLFTYWAIAVVSVVGSRALARALVRRSNFYLQNAVIVGAGEVGQMVAKKILQHPEYGLNLVGLVDADPKERRAGLEHLAMLGAPERLPELVDALELERVIISFSRESEGRTIELVKVLRALGVQVDIVPRLFDVVGPTAAIHKVEGLPLVGLPPLRLTRSALLIKRTMDLVLSIGALFVLAPLLIVIALRVKLNSPGPVLYRHPRVGKQGRPFLLLKFRTMHMEHCRGKGYGGDRAEEEFRRLMSDPAFHDEFDRSYKLKDDPRVTRVGSWLRRTSLDELPQLLNVVAGNLSLVGPRPITSAEFERYGSSIETLLEIKPGVTGYWQINGRSNVDYTERVRLDLAYVSGWSLALDLVILAKTLKVLGSPHGAY